LAGSRPFGYQVGQDGSLEPVEGEQRAIKDMLKLYKTGRSLRVIADDVGKRHGLTVSHMAVQRVLRDVVEA
jgi:hypothetical protein